MSFANVVFYVGLLIVVVYKRVQGRPIATSKQLFVLPVLVTILGIADLSRPRLDAVDIAVAVVGCFLSLVLGAFRGTRVKLSRREGVPYVQWGAAAVAILALNIVAKLALDVAGVALGGSTSGVTASLFLAVGLMLVGEAAAVWSRLRIGGPSGLDRDAEISGPTDLRSAAQRWAQARSPFERP
jgi:hypothetical protein